MRFFHGALLGYNNLQMHSYIQYSCGSVSKIRSPLLQMESLTRCLGGCIFPVPEEVACSFLNIPFDIFWTKYKFGLCIKTWRRGCGCLQLSFYIYCFQSYSVPDRDFLLHYCLFRPILCY